MASDPDLVYWKTTPSLVIHEAGKVPNGRLFTDKHLCRYVMAHHPLSIVNIFSYKTCRDTNHKL